MSTIALQQYGVARSLLKPQLKDWFTEHGVRTRSKKDAAVWRKEAAKDVSNSCRRYLSSHQYVGRIIEPISVGFMGVILPILYTTGVSALLALLFSVASLYTTSYYVGAATTLCLGVMTVSSVLLVVGIALIALCTTDLLIWETTTYGRNIPKDGRGSGFTIPTGDQVSIRQNLSLDEDLEYRIHKSRIDPFVEYKHPDFRGTVFIEHWE